MNIQMNDFCVVIASHISKEQRIEYLLECLSSLTEQIVVIPIYLSISFRSIQLHNLTLNTIHNKIKNPNLFISVRPEKTPQMRHIYYLYQEVLKKHKWIMFCDDDDSYNKHRTIKIMNYISQFSPQIDNLAGLYESTFEKNHKEKRHEYWMYCVHYRILQQFYEIVSNYPHIMDNTCCDVFFAEFLRRLKTEKIFIQMKEKYYNYRVDNNQDSITGYIQSKQPIYRNVLYPPDSQSQDYEHHISLFNEYISENLSIYLHDTYLRTIVGSTFDFILQNELLANYSILESIDKNNIDELKKIHEQLLEICKELYEIPI